MGTGVVLGLPLKAAAISNPISSIVEIGLEIFSAIKGLFSWLEAKEARKAARLHQHNVKIYVDMLKFNPKEFQRKWNLSVTQYNTPEAGIFFSLNQAKAGAQLKQMSEAAVIYKSIL